MIEWTFDAFSVGALFLSRATALMADSSLASYAPSFKVSRVIVLNMRKQFFSNSFPLRFCRVSNFPCAKHSSYAQVSNQHFQFTTLRLSCLSESVALATAHQHSSTITCTISSTHPRVSPRLDSIDILLDVCVKMLAQDLDPTSGQHTNEISTTSGPRTELAPHPRRIRHTIHTPTTSTVSKVQGTRSRSQVPVHQLLWEETMNCEFFILKRKMKTKKWEKWKCVRIVEHTHTLTHLLNEAAETQTCQHVSVLNYLTTAERGRTEESLSWSYTKIFTCDINLEPWPEVKGKTCTAERGNLEGRGKNAPSNLCGFVQQCRQVLRAHQLWQNSIKSVYILGKIYVYI